MANKKNKPKSENKKEPEVKDENKVENKVDGTKEVPDHRNFIVAPINDIALVQCVDEKAAARAVAADIGYSGKLLVVEADFTELFSVSHRVETRGESMDDFVKQATADAPKEGE